jgi:putative SOS response-associated peptidase YedK
MEQEADGFSLPNRLATDSGWISVIMHPMCGRYTFTFDAKTLAAAFGMVPPGFHIVKGYNVAPGQHIVIVRPEKDHLVADVAHWGLIPGWVKDPNTSPKPINARAETLTEKPTFRSAFKRKRCIVPASGFYEWKAEGKEKQPFYIHPTEGDLFAFAGLMEDWQGPDGETMVSACIITTEPNDLMAGIHNRMPVILPKDVWGLWLDSAAQVKEVQPLLVPYPSKLMEAYPIGKAVGNTRIDGPELIVPVA